MPTPKAQDFTRPFMMIDNEAVAREIAAVLDLVAKTTAENKQTLETEIQAIKQALDIVKTEVKGENSQAVQDIKALVEKRLNAALASVEVRLAKMETDQQSTMNYMRDKANQLKDGEDADEEAMMNDLKTYIETHMPTLPVIKDYTDEIEALKKQIEALEKRPLGKAGGGVSDLAVKYSIGRLAQKETPSGDIDGANTTYTVKNQIHAVISFVINGEHITDDLYTVAGNTIEFDTALDASLSGTSFRIVYV